jgi:hypothetical protein
MADLSAPASWVTPAELYQWADEAAARLAYAAGLFVTWDTSVAIQAGTAVYELPAAHVFTLYAMAGAQPLRITRVADLWALDARWPTTTGDPQRCSFDAGRVGTVTIYPSPASGGTLGQVCQETPATIQAGASAVALPTVLQDYFSYAMLAAARGKESEARMEEMARHFGERLRLYEQVIAQLWGPGQ